MGERDRMQEGDKRSPKAAGLSGNSHEAGDNRVAILYRARGTQRLIKSRYRKRGRSQLLYELERN